MGRFSHMSKGQRAMAVAKILGDGEYKNYTLGVSKQYVSWARTTLENAPDLAANVLTGSGSLDDARSGLATARSRLRWHLGSHMAGDRDV